MNHKIYPVTEVGKVTGAFTHFSDPGAGIRTLSTDSRKLADMDHAVFFALAGRRDGHQFIPEVYQAGVRNFIVSAYDRDLDRYPGANFLVVPDTLKALQALAAHHRSQFSFPVIAITGSNGKTVVKEWLYQLLAPEYHVIRSPKSYNSQIGVPLSVWEMNESHTLAIFETGISRTGEMEALREVIQPTIGILTNIGEAHQSGFSSREEKIAEKLRLFKQTGLFIYAPFYLENYIGEIPGERRFTWSRHGHADLEVVDDEILEDKYQFLRGRFGAEEVQCLVPFMDAASVENVICCWATLLALGYDPEVADDRLEKLQPVRMRLELKNGINNCSVIDDSYSLDTSSLAIALDFLKQQNQHPKRTLILSDLPGTGPQDDLYEQVASLLGNKFVDRLIGVGPVIGTHHDKFKMQAQFFDSTEELLDNLGNLKLVSETILLKGARIFGFERISKALTQKVHETILEINLNALEFNLNFYRSQLRPGVGIMAVVKAFSYGSGSFEIANLLQFNKVDYLAVAFADEGVALRKAGITLPIMVMSADAGSLDTLIAHGLEPEVYSSRILEELITVLSQKKTEKYPVHIKLDTGMHRLGFMPAEVGGMLELLRNAPSVKVKSAFSHLVSSEDAADDAFTSHQAALFSELTATMEETLGYSFLRHLSNTSGVTRHPSAQFDMVRLGIGLYGIDTAFKTRSPLQTAVVLKTSISQVKILEPGETVGYNRRGVLPHGGKIATVKIGYADGYDRRLGNGAGKMSINGYLVPTIGNICMDMCMLDVTGTNAREGDEVIVFDEEIRIEEMARQLGTIPYEILTGVSQRVKRVYFYE
ncbi:bifunctional UDP-N-acetylmuramoyl-tripeptide:D-alanyl-D-alanine ligase/alanine racemase [Hufsiella ginkgonis]|uniref:Alanine racemase n=1 Tax=Hufsiella ginkgonis TaxID=2695274 RepID=A0A7K1XYD5_9SPHI|nr:bifunctional UDP-N-acetylmuramoyl-tripeptide:D-alanyl-D-alanine ligase/alanine racemase [Hufsiella ginkgonis]MXV15962.1 bifunctional UDP-N-acetylmuramoyl-tripeptide:D-alanyl-D-alanine ligase/alanine racemase [Hufsiella ginkgonis]